MLGRNTFLHRKLATGPTAVLVISGQLIDAARLKRRHAVFACCGFHLEVIQALEQLLTGHKRVHQVGR